MQCYFTYYYNSGVTLAVLYSVTTIECASLSSLSFITVFIGYLLNY